MMKSVKIFEVQDGIMITDIRYKCGYCGKVFKTPHRHKCKKNPRLFPQHESEGSK